MVRYADDAVLGFEHRMEAEAFLEQWRERMRKFGLELHAEKTRSIEFGRFAEGNRKRRGEGKPETFDFLGFTHICGKTRKGSWFTVRRQTVKKRLRSKLQAVRQELRKHGPLCGPNAAGTMTAVRADQRGASWGPRVSGPHSRTWG